MRTIVDLPDNQLEALAKFCSKENISRAEAVRRAVDSMLAGSEIFEREAAFGAWSDRPIDSRKFIDELREEWE